VDESLDNDYKTFVVKDRLPHTVAAAMDKSMTSKLPGYCQSEEQTLIADSTAEFDIENQSAFDVSKHGFLF